MKRATSSMEECELGDFLAVLSAATEVEDLAQRLLRGYFEGLAAGQLPEPLARWAQHRLDLVRAGGLAPSLPFTRHQGGRRLAVRFLSEKGQHLLLLQEQGGILAAAGELGLTGREAEVLAWLQQGKTNEEIGIILQISPCTVAKHLEHIYRKLGVENRMAAVALVLRSAQQKT